MRRRFAHAASPAKCCFGFADEHAATKSANACSNSVAVRCSGIRLSRKARETGSSRERTGASRLSIKECLASFTIMETQLGGCQLAFALGFPNRQPRASNDEHKRLRSSQLLWKSRLRRWPCYTGVMSKLTPAEIRELLRLEPLPSEGGYFARTYESSHHLP